MSGPLAGVIDRALRWRAHLAGRVAALGVSQGHRYPALPEVLAAVAVVLLPGTSDVDGDRLRLLSLLSGPASPGCDAFKPRGPDDRRRSHPRRDGAPSQETYGRVRCNGDPTGLSPQG